MNSVDKKVIENWKTDKEVFDNLKTDDIIEGGMVVDETSTINNVKFVSTYSRRGENQIISASYSWSDKDNEIDNYYFGVFDKENSFPPAYKNADKILVRAGL